MSTNPVQPLTPEQVAATQAKASNHSYPIRLADAFDDLVAVAADMTKRTGTSMSSVFAEWNDEAPKSSIRYGIGKHMCEWLGLISKDHDAKAEVDDIARMKSAIAQIEQDPVVQQEGQ